MILHSENDSKQYFTPKNCSSNVKNTNAFVIHSCLEKKLTTEKCIILSYY